MTDSRFIRWWPRALIARGLVALIFVALASPSVAALRVSAERVRNDTVDARGLALAITPQGEAVALDLRAQDVSLPGWNAGWRQLRWQCELRRGADESWSCAGPIRASKGKLVLDGRLSLSRAPTGGANLTLASGAASARYAWGEGTTPATLDTRDMPLSWLADVLAVLAPDYIIGQGRITAELSFPGDATRTNVQGRWTVTGLGLDTRDGSIGTADLNASGTIDAGIGEAFDALKLDATIARGAWLVSPVYVETGAQPIGVFVDMQRRDGAWRLAQWRYDDPEVLSAEGSAVLDAEDRPQQVRASRFALRFPEAYDRYLATLAAPSGAGKLAVAGTATGDLNWDGAAPFAMNLSADLSRLDDGLGRFAVEAFKAEVHIQDQDPPPSHLAWQSAKIYGLPVDAARVDLRFQRRDWRLLQPLRLGMLGGQVEFKRFSRTYDANGVAQVDAALSAHELDLARLATAVGWPAFGGSLSGEIPAVRGVGDRYSVEGGLHLNVFDGKIDVGALSLERPFGVAPSLAADLTLDDLDLGLVTQAFSFGSIEGRLDGTIKGLRLVDWAPVAMDARFRSDRTRAERQRLSQRAVNALSSVGGGISLQQSLLKVFEHFSYANLGLDLKLANNVCYLGGLDSNAGGYTIVEGSGLPRLSVVGHQRRVDWPVLVARLKAATSGTSPIIH